MHKEHFPFFKNNQNTTYLDSAATTHKLSSVIEAEKYFYEHTNSNIHRAVHRLSQEATNEYELSRKKVAEFIGTKSDNVIFTSGTTESINLFAQSFGHTLLNFQRVIVPLLEHHSNFLPWQFSCRKEQIIYSKIKDYSLDVEDLLSKVSFDTKLITLAHASNLFGGIIDLELLIKEIRSINEDVFIFVDAAQTIANIPIHMDDCGIDGLAFSGHKMYGPMGIGVLALSDRLMETLLPTKVGGGMVNEVSKNEVHFTKKPFCFEAGTPNVAGAIALTQAITFIQNCRNSGTGEIEDHNTEMVMYLHRKVSEEKYKKYITPYMHQYEMLPIFSFNMKGLSSSDVGTLLNQMNIAIRTGHHCCQPALKELEISGCCRASFGIYNDLSDVDKLFEGIDKIITMID